VPAAAHGTTLGAEALDFSNSEVVAMVCRGAAGQDSRAHSNCREEHTARWPEHSNAKRVAKLRRAKMRRGEDMSSMRWGAHSRVAHTRSPARIHHGTLASTGEGW
jgi:hypothetical protein